MNNPPLRPTGPAATVLVRSPLSGREWRVPEGRVARLSRDASADVPLSHPHVSRSAHARLLWENGRAFLVEDGPGHAIFLDGVRTPTVPVEGRVSVRLGSVREGEDLEIETVRPAPVRVAVPAAAGADVHPARHRAPVGSGHEEVGLGTISTPAALAGPAGPATVLTQAPSGQARLPIGPPLVVSCGSTTATFRAVPQRVYTLGRAPESDLAVEDARVSRRHLEAAWDGARWVVTDTSTRGTFGTGGRRLPTGRRTPVRGTVTLRLGDPVDGETATLTVAGAAPARTALRRVLVTGVLATVVTLVASLVAVIAVGYPSSTLGQKDLAVVERSVVRLTMVGEDGSSLGGGSGTIVTSDGTILTNAHVADPRAHGLAAQYGIGSRREVADAVKYVLVGVTTGRSQPVRDRYRARVQVVDGYVDLAVVKIYAKADGSPLTRKLDLPALPIGDSDAMHAGDELTVLGFPGAADSDSVTVNTGEVAGLSRDPHLDSRRAFFDSSATVRGGNSGGTAVNAAGELVGVPTQTKSRNSDVSYRVRPVEFAKPLLRRARSGADPSYRSPYLTSPTGDEQVRFLGVTDMEPQNCTEETGSTLPSGTTHYWSVFAVTNAAKHLDIYPVVGQEQGDTFSLLYASNPATPADGTCFVTEVASDQPIADGDYQARLLTGPDAEELLGEPAPFTVGTASSPEPNGTTSSDAGAVDELRAAFPGTTNASWACVAAEKNPTGATYGELCKFPTDPAVTTEFYTWSSVEAENTFVQTLREYIPSNGKLLSDGTWTLGDTECGAMIRAQWSEDGTVSLFGFYREAGYSFVVNAPTEKQALDAFESQAFPLRTPDQLT